MSSVAARTPLTGMSEGLHRCRQTKETRANDRASGERHQINPRLSCFSLLFCNSPTFSPYLTSPVPVPISTRTSRLTRNLVLHECWQQQHHETGDTAKRVTAARSLWHGSPTRFIFQVSIVLVGDSKHSKRDYKFPLVINCMPPSHSFRFRRHLVRVLAV